MARITQFKAGEEYMLKLSRYGKDFDRIAKKAIYYAAGMVADKIKANIRALPEETYRRLKAGEQFAGISRQQKQDLIASFGIAPMAADEKGDINTKLGFDGYGGQPTKKYPKGLPNQLLARSIESGSSVRKKHPFVRNSVRAAKQAAIEKMNAIIEEETRNHFRR